MADYYTDASFLMFDENRDVPKFGELGIKFLKAGCAYFYPEKGMAHQNYDASYFPEDDLIKIAKEYVLCDSDAEITVMKPNEDAEEAETLYNVLYGLNMLRPDLITQEMVDASKIDGKHFDYGFHEVLEIVRHEPGCTIYGYESMAAYSCSKPRFMEFFGSVFFDSNNFRYANDGSSELLFANEIDAGIRNNNPEYSANALFRDYLSKLNGVKDKLLASKIDAAFLDHCNRRPKE